MNTLRDKTRRIAIVSVHACPLMTPGTRSAGGMNVYLRRIAPLLAQRGFDVDVFTRNHHHGGPEVFDFDQHSRVIHLPAGDPDLSKDDVAAHLPQYIDGLLTFVASNGLNYDFVHSHYWLSADPGTALAKLLAIPHLFTYHTIAEIKERAGGDPEPLVRKQAELRASTSADTVVTLSAEESNALGEFLGLPPSRSVTVPMGVDSALFTRQSKSVARAKLGIPADQSVALFVGRIESFKGPDILVRAVGKMQDRQDIRVLLVGGTEEEHSADWLGGIADEEGVRDSLDWRHAVPQDELPAFYSAADVCVIPSRHETFGLVALEAMASGTPVVASDVGSLSSLVLEGETGYLVRSGSPIDLARAVEDLLRNPTRAQRMGDAGAEWARRFSWNESAERLVATYDSLAAMKQGQ